MAVIGCISGFYFKWYCFNQIVIAKPVFNSGMNGPFLCCIYFVLVYNDIPIHQCFWKCIYFCFITAVDEEYAVKQLSFRCISLHALVFHIFGVERVWQEPCISRNSDCLFSWLPQQCSMDACIACF